MTSAVAVLLTASAVLAFALSAVFSRMIVKRAVALDRPNGRSSHAVETPRAGGFAIATAFVAAICLLWAYSLFAGAPATDFAPLVACGLAAFAFGAVDDFKGVGARLKLIAQVVIAIAFVALAAPVTFIPLPFVGDTDLGYAAFPLTVFWIVAFMNAFNFMDGVNGIAGACAIFVLSAIAIAASSAGIAIAAPAILLACAIFGFLPLNYPGGKIFMGDGGSQFIGFMLAALAVLLSSAPEGGLSPMFTPLAFMPFLFDVFFTLAHRNRRGQNLFKAHNEHIYQLLVRLGRTHESVTAIYLTLTVISTSAAILTNVVDARWQFAAVLILIALFLPPALVVYQRAEKAGMLAREKMPARKLPAARRTPVAAE